jgi:conjugative relaxase-like TrwC/TraI family protein
LPELKQTVAALEKRQRRRRAVIGSAVYRSELALEVQRLGYHINVTKADGTWEIDGYTRDQVMAFSARREQILKRMQDEGLSGAKAAQIIALGSRQAKRDYTEDEMKTDWRKRAQEVVSICIRRKPVLARYLCRGRMMPETRSNSPSAT